MAKKSRTSEYNRAEEWLPKFICFLHDKDVVKDYKISKELARSIYFEEFKPQYNVTKFSFACMFSYLRFFKLITYNKSTDLITFKPDALNYATCSTNIVNRKKFKIIPLLKAEQENSTVHPTPAVAESQGPSEQQQRKIAFTRKECNVCNVHCSNIPTFKEHQQTEEHKLRLNYVRNKNELTNSFPGIVIESVEGLEDIIVRKNEPHRTVLNITNKTANEISIIKIREINNPPHYVSAEKIYLPHVISATTTIRLEINALFPETIFYNFPIIFTLKSADSDKEIDVLKEVIFHVHSELVDDLHPKQPYKKPPKRHISNVYDDIVKGTAPEKTTSDFTPQFVLARYRLPDNITLLLNNNLKKFSTMSRQQYNILSDINKVFADFKKEGTLKKGSYLQLCELLLFMEEHQMWINIRNYDIDDQQLTSPRGVPRNFLELSVPGLSENRPSLLRGDPVYIKESKDSSVKFEGLVQQIKLSSVVLGFSYRFINNVHRCDRKYSVSFGFNRVALRAEHQALELIKQHNVIRFILCGEITKPNPLKLHHISWRNQNIMNNEEQQQAVRHILSETSRPAPYLIFGPPGTGKTVTIVEAILQIWTIRSGQNILVCAPSNYAADEIAKRLVVHVPQNALFRYVAPSYPYDFVDSTVKPYTNYKDGYYHPNLKKLQSYRIVITTLITASRLVNLGTPSSHFSYVFIDESGQATETETIIPIAGILTALQKPGTITGQIVLAGDPKQLGPIIQSQTAVEYGYGISMLERLMNFSDLYKKDANDQYNSNFLTKLVRSYRSHPSIIEVPNQLFYDNELIAAGDKSETHVAVGWDHLPNKKIPIIFHSVSGKDEQEANSPSFFNVQEIDIVIGYLETLIGQHLNGKLIKQKDIGVIAPYRKQVQKFKKVCEKKQWTDLTIGSVEQFQGQERMVIIVSTVRSKPQFTKHDAKFHLGFIGNPKRFNVAITRSKALLIVVGNPNILLHDEHWSAFIKYCKKHECVRGTPFELSLNTSFMDSTNAVDTSLVIEDFSSEAGSSRKYI